MRYLYANSNRTSHAVEKRVSEYEGAALTRQLCVCGWPLTEFQNWPLSFAPKHRLCKLCAREIEWRKQVLQRKYRTLQTVYSQNPDQPWRVPKGAASVALTFDNGHFYVHFIALHRVVLSLRQVEASELFECTYDPTLPAGRGVADLPLFRNEES